MTARHATELLYDSEAALRLVDSAIEDLRTLPRSVGTAPEPMSTANLRDLLSASGSLGLVGVSQILAQSYGEIVRVLGSLRESRTILERTTDTTAQQSTYASSVLTEIESRLAQLATVLDPTALQQAAAAGVRAPNEIVSSS
jgi:hypothetical protein